MGTARRILLSVLGAAAGCSHHPTITYPDLPEVGAREAALDCPGIELSIARTDTVRWVMREDGAHLLTSSDILGRLVLGVASSGILTPPEEGHYALDDVDRRLRDLLALKRDKGCAASRTAHPGMSDLQLLERLSELMDRKVEAGSERQRLHERTRLLDGLRAVDQVVNQSRRSEAIGGAVPAALPAPMCVPTPGRRYLYLRSLAAAHTRRRW